MRLVGIFLGFAVILVFAGHALAEIPDADPEDFRALYKTLEGATKSQEPPFETKTSKGHLVDYEKYFFPLDRILHWNRMYGRRGFVQYQATFPLERADGLRRRRHRRAGSVGPRHRRRTPADPGKGAERPCALSGVTRCAGGGPQFGVFARERDRDGA